MVIKDYTIDKKTSINKYSESVEVHMGSNYCILSCSKHNLSEFVSAIDDLLSRGWTTASGITSEDGKLFQSMSRLPHNIKHLTKDEGV